MRTTIPSARRRLSATWLQWLFVLLLATALHVQAGAQTGYDSVDPFIGTSNGGNTFPGATLPFGMVQWSPDTNDAGFYIFGEKTIRGFSLTHLSGAGCPVFADMPILPWIEAPAAGASVTAPEMLAYDHAHETAHPGYYSVTLQNGIFVELAVTERAGIAHLSFPKAGHPGFWLNRQGSANSDVHMAALPPAGREHDGESLTLHDGGLITGTVTAGGFCASKTRYTLHIALEMPNAPERTLLFEDGKLTDRQHAAGRHASAWISAHPDQLLKVGLSYVSEDNALVNLRTEIPGWNLQAVHQEARAAWSRALEQVQLEGASPVERTIWYTALYHNLIAPNLASDTNGEYEGFDWQVHHLSPGQLAQYANFSDWDTYRNTTPLQAWLQPSRASDMAQSLVNTAEQTGSLPRWPIANDVSYVMGGDSSAILLAEYAAFGAHRFQQDRALHFMAQGATVPVMGLHETPQRVQMAEYRKLGYLPSTSTATNPWNISASETLEFANADFAIGQFANSLGDRQLAQQMNEQAGNWRQLLDPETHWIRPRNADGTWLTGFDAEKSLPRANNAPVSTDQQGFQEGNTYQYSFMVPFDYSELFQSMGGAAVTEQRLDRFFQKLVCWGEPCFNMANEPDFVTPYAYTFLGKPWKTAEVVTRIENETFQATPGGLAGNDDLGATSGVYLWNALGMYPAIPGMSGVVLGTPRFSHATLQLAAGKRLIIDRLGNGIYVESVRLNGKPWKSSWLPLSALIAGENRLQFLVSTRPGAAWATAVNDRPPSLSGMPSRTRNPAP